jgi:glycosyltransferase involved in cell wall biosynthesis
MLENQHFTDFELIFVDNGSQDGSTDYLRQLERTGYSAQFVFNLSNLGICKAFNIGVQKASGIYLIDLAADDVFLPTKLASNFELLEQTQANLLFSDCYVGQFEQQHSSLYPFNYQGKGNYFEAILATHCLSSPTMVFKRDFFISLGTYDEDLSYEDFDFMLRASYASDLVYDPEPLLLKQFAPYSLSTQFKRRTSQVHQTTYKVCHKVANFQLNKSQKQALKKRIKAETNAQILLGNFGLVFGYLKLWYSIKSR